MFYQVISMFGAALILIAYAGHQMNRIPSEGARYQALNFFGGILLSITAIAGRQYGFIVLEGAWTAISAIALYRHYSRMGVSR